MKETVGVLLILGSLVLVIASVIGLIHPLPFAWLRRRLSAFGGVVVAVIAFGVGGSLLPPAPPAPPAAAAARVPPAPRVAEPVIAKPTPAGAGPSLKSAADTITKVEVDGQTLMVDAMIKDDYTPDGMVMSAGDTVRSVGIGLQKPYAEAAPGVNGVIFFFDEKMVDRLGHESAMPAISVGFPIADLKAANFDNLQYAGAIDLADQVMIMNKPALASVVAYCVQHPDWSTAFCKRALKLK